MLRGAARRPQPVCGRCMLITVVERDIGLWVSAGPSYRAYSEFDDANAAHNAARNDPGL